MKNLYEIKYKIFYKKQIGKFLNYYFKSITFILKDHCPFDFLKQFYYLFIFIII